MICFEFFALEIFSIFFSSQRQLLVINVHTKNGKRRIDCINFELVYNFFFLFSVSDCAKSTCFLRCSMKTEFKMFNVSCAMRFVKLDIVLSYPTLGGASTNVTDKQFILAYSQFYFQSIVDYFLLFFYLSAK